MAESTIAPMLAATNNARVILLSHFIVSFLPVLAGSCSRDQSALRGISPTGSPRWPRAPSRRCWRRRTARESVGWGTSSARSFLSLPVLAVVTNRLCVGSAPPAPRDGREHHRADAGGDEQRARDPAVPLHRLVPSCPCRFLQS